MLSLLAACLVTMFAIVPLGWAQKAQGAGVPVHMIVTVEPRHGNEPPPISRDDVRVNQGHERLQVTGWAPLQGNIAGIELYLLIGDSLGANFSTRIGDLQNFVRQQPETTAIGVAYMHNGTIDVVQKPTRDHEAAAKSIRLPQGVSEGSSYESLVDLIKQWPVSGSRREVLMLSHGIEPYGPAETSNPSVEKAIATAQRAEIPVFTVYSPAIGHWGHSWWRATWGETYLSQLADETGGEGYGRIGFDSVSFAPYLDQINQRLRHQYELTFLAKAQKSAGMQQVRVTTEVPNVDLVAADAVFVPAAQ